MLVFSFSAQIHTAICLRLGTVIHLVLLWPSPSYHIEPPRIVTPATAREATTFLTNSLPGSNHLRSKLLSSPHCKLLYRKAQQRLTLAKRKALTLSPPPAPPPPPQKKTPLYQRKSLCSSFKSGFVYKSRLRKHFYRIAKC